MQVNFVDKEYTLDLEDLDLSQARAIKVQTGLTIAGLKRGLFELDPEALAALYWLMLNQSGQTVDLRKVNFKVAKFATAVGDAYDREEAAELGITVEELTELKAEADKADLTVEQVLARRAGENPTEEPAE